MLAVPPALSVLYLAMIAVSVTTVWLCEESQTRGLRL